MTRVIHTGDTHLGYRQYHSPERRDDFLAAFRRVIDDAVADDVDAVVHAGDLYHDRRPQLSDLLGTIGVLRTLREADVPFLAVVGNHEGTRDAQWLDLFETLDLATRLDADGTVVGDTTFYGLDYVPESKRDALDYQFAPPDTDHAALVSHGLFTPFAHANWDTETVLSEANVDFDAVLLGDNHAPGQQQFRDTWVTYCGSTERVSAAERDDRGYNVVTFDGEVHITRRGVETRPFVFVDLDLAASEGVSRVRERIREEDVEDAVVIVTLEGDGGQVTPAEIETFGEEQGALVTRVNDRRELADPDADVDVSFADPDEAVRERVRALGLSEAARSIDETVREGKVADSNVRETVEGRVRDLVEDDLDAFTTAPDEPDADADAADADGPDGDADTDGDADINADSDSDDDSAESPADQEGAQAPDDEPEPPANDEEQADVEEAQSVNGEEQTDTGEEQADTGEEQPDAEAVESGTDEPPDDSADESDGGASDGQVTMEDYL